MSEFINTIDALGDDVVIDSIIVGDITEFKDNAVTNVGQYVFKGCTELTDVDVPNALSLDKYAFQGCRSLKTLHAPNVTFIDNYAFSEDSALRTVDLPVVTSIGASAFNLCSSLSTLILRNTNMVCALSNVNAIGNSTPIASGTGYIYVPSALVDSYKADSKWSTFANQFRKLEEWTVDGTVTGELDTNRHMVRFFNGDTLLQSSILSYGEIPVYEGETPIDPSGDGGDFIGWSPAIASVTGDVDYIAQFKVVPQLAYELEAFSTAYYVTGIGDVTDTDIVIPSIYKGKPVTYIRSNAFKNNTAITSLTVIGENLKSIDGYAFDGCTGLKSITFYKAPKISMYAFLNCGNVETIRLGRGTLDFGNYAFAFENLKSMYLESLYEWCAAVAEGNANPCYGSSAVDVYANNELITDVIFPSEVTTISATKFIAWHKLQSVEIHDGVTDIKYQAFDKCTSLVSVKLPTTPPTVHKNSFRDINSNCVFYVPTGSLSAYQSATNWSTLSANYSFVEEDR